MAGEYRLQTAMACQTRVEDGMYLVQIPFAPAEKPTYDLGEETADASVFLKYFPEIARCVSCNTCTKACPQDLEVMDCIQAALRGDFESIAEDSFDCIQCGLCAMRCPGEIVHYHVSQLGRRVYGKYELPRSPDLAKRIEELDSGAYDKEFEELLSIPAEELKERYVKREIKLD
jgi:ferredoxin